MKDRLDVSPCGVAPTPGFDRRPRWPRLPSLLPPAPSFWHGRSCITMPFCRRCLMTPFQILFLVRQSWVCLVRVEQLTKLPNQLLNLFFMKLIPHMLQKELALSTESWALTVGHDMDDVLKEMTWPLFDHTFRPQPLQTRKRQWPSSTIEAVKRIRLSVWFGHCQTRPHMPHSHLVDTAGMFFFLASSMKHGLMGLDRRPRWRSSFLRHPWSTDSWA